MRKSTLLWLMLAAFCGTLLYVNTSQKVTDGRSEIAQLYGKISREQESLRVLEAEWGYLNQPDRLEKLARGHLQIEPMKGRQFAKTADLPERLEPLPPTATEKEIPLKEAAPEKNSTEKITTEKPAAPKVVPKPAPPSAPVPVVRLQKPAPTPLATATLPKPAPVKPLPTPQTAKRDPVPPTPAQRDFNDLMKSLGVQ